MSRPIVNAIVAFVPSKDFDKSKNFYLDLGCEQTWGDEGGCGLRIDGKTIILQNFYVKDHAENFMMQLMVDDLDAWWSHIDSLDLAKQFGVPSPKPPAMQPWGLRVAYVVDPSGVLWHVAQRRENAKQDMNTRLIVSLD